jgi:hypothetical protein
LRLRRTPDPPDEDAPNDPLTALLLSGSGVGSSPGGSGGGQPPRRRRPSYWRVGDEYDPAPLREETRSWLAQGLLVLLGAVALSLVGLLAANLLNEAEAKDLATGVLSPIVAVTGTALGFYFGGHRDSK